MGRRPDVQVRVFTDCRAVMRLSRGQESGIEFVFMPKIEPVRTDPWHLFLPARARLRPLLLEFNPDVVHGFGTEAGYALLAVTQGRPSVISVQGIMGKLAPYQRGAYPPGALRLFRALERWALRRASGITVENEFARSWATGIVPSQRVRVIPHALNPEFLAICPDYGSPRLLCIGSLSRIKGVDTVLRAFARCRNKEARLCIIGEGSLRPDLMRLADNLEIVGRVEFTGQLERARVMDQMGRCRGLVMGSRMDTSPNAITEAHAASLPVVATRTGGIPELVDDNKDGFLVAVDDADAMAVKMEALLEDVDLCRRMGQAGREKVKELNDPNRIAQMHLDYYGDIMKENRNQ
jgi:glycosyltransferase involved in cell wall biosynthesis